MAEYFSTFAFDLAFKRLISGEQDGPDADSSSSESPSALAGRIALGSFHFWKSHLE
jgi:hypothetical protein